MNLCKKYPSVRTNFLICGSITEAIRKYQQRVKAELTANCSGKETKLWSSTENFNKSLVSVMTGSDALPTGFRKWDEHMLQKLKT